MLSASEIREETSKNKLKEDENPSDLFEAIAEIENQARKIQGYSITKREMCSKFIMAAPKMYKSGINQVQRSKGIRMTVDDLEGEMVPL